MYYCAKKDGDLEEDYGESTKRNTEVPENYNDDG